LLDIRREKPTMSDEKYNGWTNYETWLAKLWIDNEYDAYRWWRDQTRHIWKYAEAEGVFTRVDNAVSILAKALRDEYTEAMPELTGFWQGLLTAALQSVNWVEIAEAMLEDDSIAESDDEDNDE
jgi:hypothetical protein